MIKVLQVALVITIIVMLILAGVSLSLTIGENGILTQAKNAVTKTREASEKEEIALGNAALEIDYMVASTNDPTIDRDTYVTKPKIQNLVKKNKENASYVTDGELTIEKELPTSNSNETILIIKVPKGSGEYKYYSVKKEKNNAEQELVIKDAFKVYQCLVRDIDLYTEVGLTWGEWLETPYNENKILSIYNTNKICKHTDYYNDNGVLTSTSTQVLGYFPEFGTGKYWDCVSDHYINYNTADVYSLTTDVISPEIPYGCVYSSVGSFDFDDDPFDLDDW